MAIHIAVCNHSPTILERFRTFLEAQGFVVQTFLQELGVMLDLSQFSPDLVILGHIRGYPSNFPEFIGRLRANAATAALPIVICATADVQPSSVDGQENVSFITISFDALNLDYVLIGIRLALKLDGGDGSSGDGSRSDGSRSDGHRRDGNGAES